MARTLHANNEAVAIAFLKTVPGINALKIATVLPADKAAWAASGFIQVTAVGGSPSMDLPQANPVLTVDCWANNGDSAQAPWGKAANLAENIRYALYTNPTFFGKQVDPGSQFALVRVLSAWFITEPRRITGDPNAYARFSFDLTLVWTEVAAGV